MHKSLYIRILFYTCGLSICLYGYFSERRPQKYNFLGPCCSKLLLMTYNGMILTMITILLGIYILINKLFKRKIDTLLKLHSLFSNISYGLEIVVVSVYWPMNFIKPELINSSAYKYGYRIPFFKQMSIHVFPFIICLVEVLTCKIDNTLHKYVGMFVICTCYSSAITIFCGKFNFKYPYGFLKKLNFFTTLLLFYALT
ncbi:hypothetical protein TUBRATIS_30280, partial [Tubulinosema ratisbonensis]